MKRKVGLPEILLGPKSRVGHLFYLAVTMGLIRCWETSQIYITERKSKLCTHHLEMLTKCALLTISFISPSFRGLRPIVQLEARLIEILSIVYCKKLEGAKIVNFYCI